VKFDILRALVRGIVDSDMDEAFTFIVIDGRNPDLAEYNGTVRDGCAAYSNKILLERKPYEICIRYSCRSGPHFGFMLVPVFSTVDDVMLDLLEDVTECFEGVGMRGMRLVQENFFGGLLDLSW